MKLLTIYITTKNIMSYVTAEEFTHTKVQIKAPKKVVDKQGKTKVNCYVLYEYDTGVAPLYLKTPKGIRSPFGFSKYEKGSTGDFDYSLPLTQRCFWEGENSTTKRFFEELQQLDKMLIDYGVEYSKIIMNKQYTPEQSGIVEAMFTRCVSVRQDKEGNDYPPMIGPKFQKDYETGLPTIELFVNSSDSVPNLSWDNMEENLTRNCSVTGLLQPRIWIVNGRFGCKLQYVSSLFVIKQQKMTRPSGFIFGDTLSKVATSTKSLTSASASASASVSTSTSASANASASTDASSDADEAVEDSEETDVIDDSDEEELET